MPETTGRKGVHGLSLPAGAGRRKSGQHSGSNGTFRTGKERNWEEKKGNRGQEVGKDWEEAAGRRGSREV